MFGMPDGDQWSIHLAVTFNPLGRLEMSTIADGLVGEPESRGHLFSAASRTPGA